MVEAVGDRADRGQMKYHFGLHFSDCGLHGEMIAQITMKYLHRLIRARNRASGHVSLQRMEIVPAHFREALEQSAPDKPSCSGHENSHARPFLHP
jgi:hypothetical protein